MKKSVFMIVTMMVICMMSVSVYAVSFNDVSGHWAESFINRWSEEKVINGYEDNTFKPNNNITRAEYIAMIMRVFEPTNKADLSKYTDVNTSAWYYDTLAKGSAMGAIQGYEDNTLKPDAYITRQEAIVILNRIIKLTSAETANRFTDASEIATWAKDAITAFSANEYINGYEDGSIHPTAYITRAEITKILDKAISKMITNSGEIDLSGVAGSVVVKKENVTLKNDETIQKVFALNEQIKNSLTTSKEVIVINSESSNTNETQTDTTKDSNENGGGAGGTTPAVTDNKYTVTLTSKGNQYEVTKEGNLEDGAKVTLIVDGKTIIKEKEFSEKNFFQFKLDLLSGLKNGVKNKTINAQKLLATLKSAQSSSSSSLEEDILNSLSDAEKTLVTELLGDGSGKSLQEIYQGLSDDEIFSLGTMFLDMDYDTLKTILENM